MINPVHFELKDIEKVSSDILKKVDSKILLFYGEMGVGKTTLIKALIGHLCGSVHVTSPTYSLVNEYSCDDQKIYHLDMYRIKSLEEAFDIGLEDYLESDAWIFVEWPTKIEPLLPECAVKVHLEKKDECSRALDLEFVK